MDTVVGLFRRRRDAVHAWLLLRRQGFRTRELRIIPYDRFVQERVHPTISSARTIHEYICTSGGTVLGGLSGMLVGFYAFVGADPSAVFMVAAASAGLGGLGGRLLGRYDPSSFAFAMPYHGQCWQRGGVLLRVAVAGDRAAHASAVMRRAAALKVFGG